LRQIVGTEGWLCFNNLDVVIGLGDATTVDLLRVEWPSGRLQELRDVAVNQTLVMVEQTTVAITNRVDAKFELTLTGPRQQRYSLEASTDLRHWSPMASLTITNADGTAAYQTVAGAEPARYYRAVPK